MAEKFAGYSDVDDFIHQFETIAIIKNWSAEQKRVAIALYLEGPTLSWLYVQGQFYDIGVV